MTEKKQKISTICLFCIMYYYDYVLLLCIRISVEEQPYSRADYSDERWEIVQAHVIHLVDHLKPTGSIFLYSYTTCFSSNKDNQLLW